MPSGNAMPQHNQSHNMNMQLQDTNSGMYMHGGVVSQAVGHTQNSNTGTQNIHDPSQAVPPNIATGMNNQGAMPGNAAGINAQGRQQGMHMQSISSQGTAAGFQGSQPGTMHGQEGILIVGSQAQTMTNASICNEQVVICLTVV